MSREEAFKKLQEEDSEVICKYCEYELDCNKGVSGGPNGPIYPPCNSFELEDLIDIDAYIEDMEVEE